MLKLIKMGKLSEVALIQNIVRKIILKDGHLEIQYQKIVQKNFMNNKKQMLMFLQNCINNYMIFSPLYQSTLNYFNHNGQTSICWTVSCYISMLRFLISLCKTLDLQFKAIFSESETFRKQFIGSLIQINRQHIKQLFKDTSDAKLTIIVYEIELINNMMLGPVESNIKTALKYRYQQIISLIKLADQHQHRTTTFKIIIKLKKHVVQGLLILSSVHKFTPSQIHKIEQGLITYYKSTNKLVKDDINSIIDKYTKQNKQSIEVMNFDLALIMYFCIVQIYEKESINTLKIMKTDALRQIRLVKSYNKKFKMFYQLYRILSDLMSGVGRFVSRCCRKTTRKIDEAVGLFGQTQITHEQNLQQAFKFFVQNVSSVQIQVGKQLQTVYFLLLKQTQCYNTSIRKQLHRRVGLGQRQYKMLRFISQINHVILRLQIEKNIKQSTLKYKPIQIIVKNRQLWKSLNFLCACLLNLLFLDQDNIANQPIAMIVLRALSYLFCIFLFMIYFIQNLPLKRRLSQEMAKSDKPQKFKQIKACLEIFNDKTLWFAVIYFVVISASLYQEGFVAILMIDFFVRFKISKKVTQIVTRPLIQLLLIILVSVQIAFVFTYYLYFLGDTLDCESAPQCIQQTYFQYLGLTKNNVLQSQFGGVQFRSIIEFFATFFAIMINNSLIISVLLYEKQAKDIKVADWQFKVKERCFICDSERNVVDRARNNNKGFFEHIQQEHNLWNYVFYLVYLKNKDLDSLNIVENMVMTSWKQNKIDWFPTTFKA